MILEQLSFLIGLITGCFICLILFFIIFREDFKSQKEFDERQKKYKRMI